MVLEVRCVTAFWVRGGVSGSRFYSAILSVRNGVQVSMVLYYRFQVMFGVLWYCMIVKVWLYYRSEVVFEVLSDAVLSVQSGVRG